MQPSGVLSGSVWPVVWNLHKMYFLLMFNLTPYFFGTLHSFGLSGGCMDGGWKRGSIVSEKIK